MTHLCKTSCFSSENFWINPQYRLTVKAVEEDAKGDNNVLLSDEEYRSKVKYHAIAFTIYKVPSEAPKGRLPSSLFWDKEPLKVSEFSESRELIEFHGLEPGEYLIVPCTYEPNKTASFIITIYSKAETEMKVYLKPLVNMPGTCTSIINLRYQDGSEGSPSNPAKYNNQDYTQLKESYLRRRRQFVDNTFPPDNHSLGDLPNLSSWREVKWLRPVEILKLQNIDSEPAFCTNGASRFDFGQGGVGNCWFLAAISALTFHESLLVQVVPMDQSFNNYAGIFHFRFWRFGKWIDVVIDDYLPTLDNCLLSVHTKGENEFWVPLLEKAYAKVCGSYADMNTGLPSEACKDFSGGVHMTYQLREVHTANYDTELWQSLSNASGCNSMICCGSAQKGGKIVNTVADTGLVDGHAYSVTAVTEVEYYGSKVKLVRVMNPWGQTEWNGKWSDKSDLWQKVRPEDREKCSVRNDGEFWMELEDFYNYFVMLSICCENPNFLDGDFTCQWKCMIYDGSWVAGRSAGGNVNKSSFATNPQYRIQVTIIDEKEQGDKNILLSLMQKPLQQNRKSISSYPIGLTIFKVPPGSPRGRLPADFFRTNRPVKDASYTNQRDLIENHSMEPGEYVIVPSTIKPNMSAEFVLTVYSKSDAKITPHDGHDDDDDDVLPEVPTEKEKDPMHALLNHYADQNGELNARQLQKLLNENFPHGTRYGFALDNCSSMMALVDTDRRMTMSFSEFSTLWEKMNEYKKLFHRTDLNQKGSLSDYELKRAIEAAGMDVNDGMVRMMMFRYSGFSSTTMDSFIVLMLRLEKTSSIFKDRSTDGVIHMTWEEWSSSSLYN
ncbi:calpain-2 catalytic subunit-like [Morone saxatilis]|uniref:calpain-2 catalytic subunit-like n=1 Tax=Morone saxatilis TaxID=34816 RepID=UPI0015E1EC9B|nr:calpain-2 catalytic subunit-like [Morone saxatilis]